MVEQSARDLKLVGTASSLGGRYRNVKVTGEAELNSDTTCERMSLMGTARIHGDLKAGWFKQTGEASVEGNLDLGEGTVMGQLQLTGAIRAQRLKVTGELKTERHCEAETLELGGAFTLGGMLNAGSADIKLYGLSRAAEIGVGSLTVKRSRTQKLKSMFGMGTSAMLEADLIEGDTLALEHTRAAVVRGTRVSIGPGCDIGRVEYRGELRVSPSAKVAAREKI